MSLWLALLLASAAGAGEPKAPAPRVIEGEACAQVATDSEGAHWEKRCGFSAALLSPDGARVLSLDWENAVQLWGEKHDPLATLATRMRGAEAMGFVGTRAVLLDGDALVVLDARDGKQLGRFPGMPGNARFGGAVGLDAVMIAAEGGGYDKEETLVVSLVDGRILARGITGRRPMYRSGARWAAGVTTHKDDAGVWRATLHLADEALTQVPLDFWCYPIGPRPQCATSDVAGSRIRLFDLATRRWTVLDVERPLRNTTMIEWVQAGDRTFANICALQRAPGAFTYACDIVDIATGQTLHRFSAPRYSVAAGTDAQGAPELRIRTQPFEYRAGLTVTRVAMDGRITVAALLPDGGTAALLGPGGDIWVSSATGPLTGLGPDGAVRALLDRRFGTCIDSFTTWLDPDCPAQGPENRVVTVVDDRIVWGRVGLPRD